MSINGIGERLREQRHRLGWTQELLAERVGTSQAVITKIENGHVKQPRIIEELACGLGVSRAWLQFGELTMRNGELLAGEVAASRREVEYWRNRALRAEEIIENMAREASRIAANGK